MNPDCGACGKPFKTGDQAIPLRPGQAIHVACATKAVVVKPPNPSSAVRSLIVPGIPRTKKNSGRIVPLKTGRGKRHIILPSEAWEVWCRAAVPKLAAQLPPGHKPIASPVNCRALFYRDALRGDAVGFYQGLADLLQHAKVVVDDKWIVSWDGSRLLKDADRPRVEVFLEPI